MPSLPVYVPRPSTAIAARALPMSAIIGRAEPDDEGYVTVYFEGNAFGAENLQDYHSRLVTAAGRARDSYPTTAIMRVSEADMARVAEFDPVRHVFTEIHDPATLEMWSGEPIEETVGVRLPVGAHDRLGNTLVLNQTRPLGFDENGYMFRTRAGQIIVGDGADQFRVYDHDDPEIMARLTRALARNERQLAYAIGADALSSSAPTGRMP